MIRSFLVILSVFLVIGLTNCGATKVVYTMAEDQFVYQRDSLPYGEQKILAESFASFLTYEFNEGNEPLQIYVRLNGLMPWINTIEHISLELEQKNEKGEMITVKPKELKEFKVEYSNGNTILSLPIKNEHIGAQVNWKEADWGEYTKNNSVGFNGTFVFEPTKYPATMLMKFKIVWKEGEKQFETTLTKGDYVGRKLNPKF